jgi:predicted alpha/beta-hydrolase family hydrolase
MRKALLAGLLLVLGLGARAAEETRAVLVPAPRGVKLEAVLHVPASPNGCAVVLAPGQGYHKELPLLKACAERLAAAGFLALRFDWGYFTAKGAPSPDLAVEREDLDAALTYAKGLAGVSRVILAGKSLGSMVALLRAADKGDDLAGVALLTLPVEMGGARVAEAMRLKEVAPPVLVACGDRDRLCPLRLLYALAADCPRPPSLVIAPGDHGFREGEDAAKEAENVARVADALVLWARRRLP